MPITCQPQANFLYTLFLIFIKICKVGIKYSSQSTRVLKKKTFWEETKEKNKTKPWNKWEKKKEQNQLVEQLLLGWLPDKEQNSLFKIVTCMLSEHWCRSWPMSASFHRDMHAIRALMPVMTRVSQFPSWHAWYQSADADHDPCRPASIMTCMISERWCRSWPVSASFLKVD